MDSKVEAELRGRIMAWVGERAEANGGFLHRQELLGFRIDGQDLPVIDFSRGIRNPAAFTSTLSIVATANGPYDDTESDDGLLRYSYRKGDPWSGDNRKLRTALETGQPLILFRKEVANYYTPVMPVYVVDDEPENRAFVIALDEAFRYMGDVRHLAEPQRQYAMRLAKQRLHQPAFRTRVLLAYQTRCAVCSLKHGSLLDAAHIVPDGNDDPRGLPTTPNGLALCKIHHAAYDQNMLGVSPDYTVEINRDVLEEIDGPMLKHGIQAMHGRTLTLPSKKTDRPKRELLAWRWERFAG
ncbi:HNH endonuclease [Cellulomonas bogoriensis]|uniref:Restriction endonuclease n=1 Tax=Cellulomonas bogoriensis 69B4 = DSM 16987 TaxID=1386082 RepID=A0A0A0C0E2_9CELL|nr:HNH endonuclease [Cellulomonas bogoriensis]KGM13412.1 restriction endonuclease [Cellulomonas bogoriensis 69B4 = DSM 16987]